MTTSKQKISPDNLQGYYAGFISRLIAFVIDIAIINLSLLFIGWFLGIFLSFFEQSSALGASLENIPYINDVINLLLNPVFIALFIFGFVFIYFTFFWSFSGHTPGKVFMGLRVVPVQGGKMSLKRSILRLFAYIPSILSLGIGFLWIIIDDQRQAWQDTLARTFVIYTWKARPDEDFLSHDIQKFQSSREAQKKTKSLK
jgi:uncharacterized RDD family membrane protein YckC